MIYLFLKYLYLFNTNYNKTVRNAVKPSDWVLLYGGHFSSTFWEFSQHFYKIKQFLVNMLSKKFEKMLTKCGLFCRYIPKVYNIKRTRPHILCEDVLKNTKYSYFARLTATAQATVAPTIGLLPYQNTLIHILKMLLLFVHIIYEISFR